MNTVLKGDTFEQNSYFLIKSSIENDQFGISPKHSKVFLKKGYYSSLRGKDIIFDLSIEIWLPNAERYSVLYLIECKDYSNKKVPVDDVEEFITKINQIAGLSRCVKGVMISNNSFQSGALEVAKRAGLMLIEVTENELSIKLYKAERIDSEINEIDKEMESFLFSVFDLNKVAGLKNYSRKAIEEIANSLNNEIDNTTLKFTLRTPIEKIINFLKDNYNLQFDFQGIINQYSGKSILGYFDVATNTIKIDLSVVNTERFAFLFAHEIGHFILHRELKINQQVYDKFQDSEYNFVSNKYLLNNYKNWIEWQANEFASCLIMPNNSFYTRLIAIQKHLGISRTGHIYLDDQPINRRDFGEITTYLVEHFNTTYTSIIYKLEGLDLITYNRKQDDYLTELRDIYTDINLNF
jgi:Zn-dependent peptidase ImmA (M78 family)